MPTVGKSTTLSHESHIDCLKMGKLSRNKRPLEPQNIQSDTPSRASKRPKGPGHVQNALNQTPHEASSRSKGSLPSPAVTSPQPDSISNVSLHPTAFAQIIPPVPAKQLQQSNRSVGLNAVAELPQLPSISDANLEQAVFTHQSYLPGHNQDKLTRSYDRLEFLGDAYIEVIASQLVYSLYPHMPAGRLSQQRENLVKNESLAAHSSAYGFDKRARLRRDVPDATTLTSDNQQDETKGQTPRQLSTTAPSKPDTSRPDNRKKEPRPSWANTAHHGSKNQQSDAEKQRTKTLGDIFEAYVAAIVLSDAKSGYRVAQDWLHKLWIPKLEAQSQAETRAPPPANAKNELAKRVMGKGIRLEYRDTAPPDQSESKAGKTWYTIGAFLTGWGWSQAKLGEGRALNKNQAGSIAAARALENPLTEQVSMVKKDFDSAVARERAAKEQPTEQREQKSGDKEGSTAVPMTTSQRDGSEADQNKGSSGSDESDDSDTS